MSKRRRRRRHRRSEEKTVQIAMAMKRSKVERVCQSHLGKLDEDEPQSADLKTRRSEDVRLYFTARLSWFRAEEIEVVFVWLTIAIAQVRRLLREVTSESDVGDDGDVQRWRVSVACCPGGDPLCERGRETSPIDVDLVLGISSDETGCWRMKATSMWKLMRVHPCRMI